MGKIGIFSKGSGGTKEDEISVGVPCVRYGDLYTSYEYVIRNCQSFIAEEKISNYTPIFYGDVLFAGSGETIEEIGKSAVNLIRTEAYCGGDVIIFRPKIGIDAAFSGYAIDCLEGQRQKSLMGRGITVMHIYSRQLKNLRIGLPPLDEQAKMVGYLDEMTHRLSQYEISKGRLVELLEEERRSIINQAVTRGLDSSVMFKLSGIERLGDVPAHWEVCKLKQKVKLNNSTLSETTDPYFEFGYIDIGSVNSGRLSEQPQKLQFYASPSRARRIVENGDTIVSTVRTYLKATWFAENISNIICSTGFAVLTPGKDLSPKFVSYVAQSNAFTDQVMADSVGVAYPAISDTRLGSLFLCIPPLDEQAAIVEHLDKVTVDIDVAIAKARRQIELLQEYRTRLIADVVTGKLDVREAVAQLPEDGGEVELIGDDLSMGRI